MIKKIISSFLLLCFFTSCFGSGIDKRGTVYGYNKGVIKTNGGGKFLIGSLPSYWQEQRTRVRAILFKNTLDASTISVSSWCKGAIDDAPQKELSQKLLRSLSQVTILDFQEEVPVGTRVATVTTADGELDNLPVYLKSAVIKMNDCVFDFYYVSTPGATTYESDFDLMLQGFRYIRGPDLL